MRNLKKIGAYCIAALCFVSCGKLNLSEKEEKQQIQNLETDSIQAISGSDPNEYSVLLSWSGSEKNQIRYILRDSNNSEEQEDTKEFHVSKNNFKFFDHEVVAGEDYSYRLYTKDPNTSVYVKEFNITVPEDLVIDGESRAVTQNNTENLGRIYLLNEGVLKTNGAELRLEVNSIHSEGGSISSHFSSHAGRQGRNGRTGSTGGAINITTRNFFGDLSILAYGQNGGPGYDHHFDRGNGGNGGNSSPVYIEIKNEFNGDILVERIPGSGGRGGDGRMNPDGHPGRVGNVSPYCVRAEGYQEGDGCRLQ